MSDSEDLELLPRSPVQAAQRCLALLAVVERVYEQPPARISAWVNEHNIFQYFSAEEAAFFEAPEPPEEQRVSFSWRAEAMIPLLWALGQIPKLPPLNEKANLGSIPSVHSAVGDPQLFIEKSSLRPDHVLADAEADLYHQHWRVRDAQLFQKSMPAELDPSIVYERRYALSWLVGWGEDWDDVPTDT